jgi:hypothetical protein
VIAQDVFHFHAGGDGVFPHGNSGCASEVIFGDRLSAAGVGDLIVRAAGCKVYLFFNVQETADGYNESTPQVKDEPDCLQFGLSFWFFLRSSKIVFTISSVEVFSGYVFVFSESISQRPFLSSREKVKLMFCSSHSIPYE